MVPASPSTGRTTPASPATSSSATRRSLRYVNKPFDDSTPDKRYETYKVFHQLWDPDGKQLVTDGVEDPKALYPHHRGIFYGFREVTYDDGKKTDTWHCPKAHQANEKIEATEAGPVLGRQRALIGWYGDDKDLFANEERELTVYNTPGGRLVEFASRLKPVKGTVHLDGDPQHAGFHFRAAMEVADKQNSVHTFYIRPDGVGKEDDTRNWDPKTMQGPINLPWDAMCFLLGGKRYTVAYLDRPENPKEARFSERDYGRFGSYFVADATEEKPVDVDYRLWLQDGPMTVDEVAARSADFGGAGSRRAGRKVIGTHWLRAATVRGRRIKPSLPRGRGSFPLPI